MEQLLSHLLIRLVLVALLTAVATLLFLRYFATMVGWVGRALSDFRVASHLLVVFGAITAWLLFSASLWSVPSYLEWLVVIALLVSGNLSLLGLAGVLFALIRHFRVRSRATGAERHRIEKSA